MKLSILICCSVEELKKISLANLLGVKETSENVEVLICASTHKTLGDRRNTLVQQSSGDFIFFVDPKIEYSINFFDTLLEHCDPEKYDNIVFTLLYKGPEGSFEINFDNRLHRTHNAKDGVYNAGPNDQMCYARKICLDKPFDSHDILNWQPKISTQRQYSIQKVLGLITGITFPYTVTYETCNSPITKAKNVTLFFRDGFVKNSSANFAKNTNFNRYFTDICPNVHKKLVIRLNDTILHEISEVDVQNSVIKIDL